MYVCICTYKHNRMYYTYIHIYVGWLQGYYASSILNVEVSHCSQRIFYCESCRIRAQHVLLGFGIWELIKGWNWNLGGALQLGHNCIPAPLLHTHARMQPVIQRYVCVYVCKYIYSLLKKVWDFIWVPYLNPTILRIRSLHYLSINLSTYVSIHASNYKYIYIHVYIYVYIHIYA